MANAIYPNFKEALLDGSANTDMSAGDVKVALVDTGTYTYSAAHTFLTDLTGVTAASGNLTTKTFTGGTFDIDDFTFTAVTGAVSEAIVVYIDTGAAGTSRLVAFIDAATGLPVTPNGGDITFTVNAAGLFTI